MPSDSSGGGRPAGPPPDPFAAWWETATSTAQEAPPAGDPPADAHEEGAALAVARLTEARVEGSAFDVAATAGHLGLDPRDVSAWVELGAELSAEEPALGLHALPERIGRYRIVSHVDGGGGGEVYRAEDVELGRTVAIKFMRRRGHAKPLDTASRQAADRFRREAQAMARAKHPHLVQVFEIGAWDDVPFLAMEFIEGQTLAGLIACEGPLDPLASARQAAGIAGALHALHERGVLHRDVKPSNLIVESGGRWVLVDLGVAHLEDASRLTMPGNVLGTLPYMSPEQLGVLEAPVGPAADIYGLGATLFEAWTGRRACRATDGIEVYREKRAELPPPLLSRDRPGASKVAERVVATCLEHRPADRFSNASEAQAALLAMAEGRAWGRGPVSPWHRRARRLLSHWKALAVLVLVAVAAATLAPSIATSPSGLDLRTVAGVTLSIDGGPPQRSETGRILLDLPPGPHTVLVEEPEFVPFLLRREIRRGEVQTGPLMLTPRDSLSVNAMRRLAAIDPNLESLLESAAKVMEESLEPLPHPIPTIVLPRGPTTLEGLARAHLERGHNPNARFIFEVVRDGSTGSPEVLASTDVPEGSGSIRLPLPPTLAAAVKPGDVLGARLLLRSAEGTPVAIEWETLKVVEPLTTVHGGEGKEIETALRLLDARRPAEAFLLLERVGFSRGALGEEAVRIARACLVRLAGGDPQIRRTGFYAEWDR